MANLRMGYIGKSFSMGILGIVGTLVACGGGGITSTVASSGTVSPYVLFASQYKSVTSPGNNLLAQSFEGGSVYAGSDGEVFKYLEPNWVNGNNIGGWSDQTLTDDQIRARQAFGVKWVQTAASTTNSSWAYVAVKAPGNGSVDISQSTKIVIQMGNGTSNQYDSNAKKVFRVIVDGGVQNSSSYLYDHSCKYDKTLDAAAISDSNQAGSNLYGLRTYEIDLADFTCTAGDMTNLKKSLKQVSVNIIGGIDAATDNTTGAYTFVQAGLIAFSKNN
jgi:hypothetical protein